MSCAKSELDNSLNLLMKKTCFEFIMTKQILIIMCIYIVSLLLLNIIDPGVPPKQNIIFSNKLTHTIHKELGCISN